MEQNSQLKEGEYDQIDIEVENENDNDEPEKQLQKNQEIYEQYVKNRSQDGIKNFDQILENIPENDRIYMILDKDSGQVIDSRNEEVVGKLFDDSESGIKLKNDKLIWKDFWKQVKELNYKLIEVAEQGDIPGLLSILQEQAKATPIDINFKVLDNYTAMHKASMNNQPEVLEILIKHGGNLEAQSTFGRRPIHLAVIKGYQSVVKKIIEYKGEIDCQDNDLQTPLHFATEKHDKEMIEILLKNNAKTEIFNQRMQHPYDCTMDIEVLNIYKKYGVKVPSVIMNQYNGVLGRSNTQVKQNLMNKNPGGGVPHIKLGDNKDNNDNDKVDSANNQNAPDKIKALDQLRNISPFRHNVPQSKVISVDQGKVGPQDFVYWKQLGKGAFGEVYLVSKDQKYYAMKILKKEKILKQKLQRYAKTEQEVLYGMNHPFITRMYYAFQTDQKLFLVLEYCPGGDLGGLLQRQKKVSEDVAKIYIAEILLALEALHKNMIIYRDLKPENVILDERGHVKLTDFGLAKKNVNDEKLNTSFLGTPAYFAPEIVTRSGHTRMLDWYNLGVLLYELLVGMPPFYARDREELYENIKKAPIKIPKSMSNEAKDLIKQLLNRNYKKRLGSERDGEEIREHPFFKDLNWNDVYNKNLKPPVVKVADVPSVPLSVKFTSEDTNKDKFDNWTYIEPSN